MQRPLKLRLVSSDEYPTDRLTSDPVTDDGSKSVEHMSEMAEFVYQLYMNKMEQLKDKLPTEEELRALRRQLPTEDDDENDEEDAVDTNEAEINEEPPQKRVANEKAKNTTEAFKPTPILNEINVDEAEVEQQKQEPETVKETSTPQAAEETTMDES